MLFGPGERPGTIAYRAEVTPGADYRVEVRQPPSSIVFTYDTSGSVGPYLEDIYHGLRAFSADVTPGKEAVLVVPFEEDRSSTAGATSPTSCRTRSTGGSDRVGRAERRRRSSMRRPCCPLEKGRAAILVVTDAETTTYPSSTQMWQAFAAVRPLVFAVHIGGSGEPFLSSTFMQDWAVAGGGVYRYASTLGEMDRPSTVSRRGCADRPDTSSRSRRRSSRSRRRRMTLARSRCVPALTGARTPIADDVGVEIILDTSGSMLEKVRRRTRIDIAKDALRDLVTERLPAGTPVALRIFGGGQDPAALVSRSRSDRWTPPRSVAFIDGLRDREGHVHADRGCLEPGPRRPGWVPRARGSSCS